MYKYLIIFFITSFFVTTAQQKIEFLVKPYIQNVADDGITILWETNIPAVGIVKYSKTQLKSNSIVFDKEAKTKTKTELQSIRLTDLEAGTKYFYKVIVFDGQDSSEYVVNQFITSINSQYPVTFAVFGDSQQQDDPTVWNRMSTMALLERPNFGIIVGDLVDEGGNIKQWRNEFLANGHEFMKTISLFGVIGNHDYINDDEAKNYHKYMKQPGDENHYTIKYGDIQIFVIDSNDDMEEDSEQFKWLENELAKSKADWKIMAHHHPPYSSDYDDFGNTDIGLPEDGDQNFRAFIPLYEKYNVDMVFYGHIHSYERTFPTLNNKVNDAGVVYVQCGGAGGNLENSAIIRSWFTAKVKSDHHFCIVSVNNRKLYFTAYDNDGRLFDQYIIDKNIKEHSLLSKAENELSAPVFKYSNNKFLDKVEVTIKNYTENSEVRYTTDGTIPTGISKLYSSPILLERTTILKAIVFDKFGNSSKLSEKEFKKIELKTKADVIPQRSGLIYKYYQAGKDYWAYLPKFNELKVVKEGVINNFMFSDIPEQEDQFAIVYNGYLKIETKGVYTFYVSSDDGAKLYIDGECVVENDGSHSVRIRKGNVALDKGYYKIALEFYDDCEGEALDVQYQLNDLEKKIIPDSTLFH